MLERKSEVNKLFRRTLNSQKQFYLKLTKEKQKVENAPQNKQNYSARLKMVFVLLITFSFTKYENLVTKSVRC